MSSEMVPIGGGGDEAAGAYGAGAVWSPARAGLIWSPLERLTQAWLAAIRQSCVCPGCPTLPEAGRWECNVVPI